MNRILFLSLILSISGIVFASDPTEEQTMEDTHWQLVEYQDDAGDWSAVLPDTTVDIRFSDGQLGGSAGCNRYFGGYTLEGENQLRFSSQIGSTQMACAPPIAKQEQRYLALLPQAVSWRMEQDLLALIDSEGTSLLEFEAVEPTALENTEWQAVGINNGRGGVVSTGATNLTSTVFSAGTLSGSGGCNRFNAAYEIDGDRIAIGPAAATRKFCADPEGIMDQEQQFFAALERAHTFTVTPGKLELRDENGSLQVSFRTAIP